MTAHDPAHDPAPRPRPGPEQPGEPSHGEEHQAADQGVPPALLDEATLRRLMQNVVVEVEPAEDALRQLQLAVPTRRRRRRQLLLGSAASVAVFALGTPVVLQTATTGGRSTDRADRVDLATDGDTAWQPSEDGQSDVAGQGSGGGDPADPGVVESEGRIRPQDTDPDPDTAGAPFPEGWDSLGVTAPRCLPDQLGDVYSELGEGSADGAIYGSVRLVNVSHEPCRVDGGGELVALSADPAVTPEVQVVDRTEGDRATGLPAPGAARSQVVLPPGEGFTVRFAWLPPADSGEGGSEGGGGEDGGGDGDTCPTPSDGQAEPGHDADHRSGDNPGQQDGKHGGASGAAPSHQSDDAATSETGADPAEDGTCAPGRAADTADDTSDDTADDTGNDCPTSGIVLRYTPPPGGPSAQLRLDGVCSGTVYRTQLLHAPHAQDSTSSQHTSQHTQGGEAPES